MKDVDRFQITVIRGGSEQTIEGKAGESLLAALARHNIYLSAACGGRGRCGKCGVQMISGVTDIREADRNFFHREQLERGMRLACESYPQGDCRILLVTGDEADFEIISDYRSAGSGSEENVTLAAEETGYDIAIDIGTTTIAASLIGRDSGNIRHTVTRINHQRVYGADVISRNQAANDGKLQEVSR
ncbi:MAG: 2Fe-2S iron-sulfur cluster binding domain-containing protein, partial [Lachnospiraceae bacterium]|nr:2Fe-2S iron-sulfur cluster binding domain-containing protein [Lachnospiraceae bacterium]